MYIPAASKNWNRMKVVGEKAVDDRIKLGSTHPDLFHYLVGTPFYTIEASVDCYLRWMRKGMNL
jgi:hypothetical protein